MYIVFYQNMCFGEDHTLFLALRKNITLGKKRLELT